MIIVQSTTGKGGKKTIKRFRRSVCQPTDHFDSVRLIILEASDFYRPEKLLAELMDYKGRFNPSEERESNPIQVKFSYEQEQGDDK